ncbi:hypothetical protein J6590_047683 [Homalodisca vitripennis]|nr:hypothetical protein J6590_047683 [Homalodisca vitripennis]
MQTQLDLNDNELNPRDIYLPSTVTSKNHLEAGSRQSMSPPALFSPRPGSSSEIAGTPPSSRSVTLSPPHRLTLSPAEVLPADRSQQTTPVIRRYPARQRKPLYDVEGELILINGSGWSAGIIPPHLMLVSNPTPQPLLPLYRPSPPQTIKRCGRFGQCVNFQTCV